MTVYAMLAELYDAVISVDNPTRASDASTSGDDAISSLRRNVRA